MRYFSSFTGVGGFDLAVPKDWECVGFSEIDRYANMVLRYRFPDIKNYGDVNAIRWEEIPDFDILFGGTPCQDLSLAGKRKGLVGERSGLFYKFVEALKAKKPEYFVWENVKGALSSNQGWDFAEVLNQFSEAGYNLWWQILNAKYFSVPQNRERIFIVGFRDRSPPEIFFEPSSSVKNNELQGQPTANTLQAKYTSLREGSYIIEGQQHTQDYAVQAVLTPDREKRRQNGRRFKSPEEPMFTLTGQDIHGVIIHNMQPRSPMRPSADRGGSGHLTKTDGTTYTIDTGNTNAVQLGNQIRRLTPRECERLMSWSDDWTRWGIDEKSNKVEMSDTQRYKMAGNGVVSNVVKWLIENVILSDNHARTP